MNISAIYTAYKPTVFTRKTEKTLKTPMDEAERLAKQASKYAKKGDYESALNALVDRAKLNYPAFLSEIIESPEEIHMLDYMKKVGKKSHAYTRAKYHINKALYTSYPSLAEQADKIIRKY